MGHRYPQLLGMRLRYLFLLFLSLLCKDLRAQVWELGVQGGGAGYMGDLNPDNPLKISGSSFGAFLKANLDPNWALSFNYNMGKIKADDAKSSSVQFQQRNLNFYNKLHEFSVLLDFNFTDYFAAGGTKQVSPYMYVGLAGVLSNPKTRYMGREYELALYTTEGQASPYKKAALSMPIGAGIKVNFSENLSVISNIGYRNAYTDYLDDVSGSYPDYAVFSNSPPQVQAIQFALSDRSAEKLGTAIGKKGTQRGDFRKRDTYMFVGIGISYTFVSQKCPR